MRFVPSAMRKEHGVIKVRNILAGMTSAIEIGRGHC
jgi:hypothetical protein